MTSSRAVPRLGLNRSELALSIGVSGNTIDKMVAEGALPWPRKWNTRKIWIVREVEAAMLEWPTDRPSKEDDDPWEASNFRPEKRSSSGKEGRQTSDLEPKTGLGGYPITDDANNPLQRWYDQLGFDPKTMGSEDMERLMAAAHAEWAAAIPGTPLGKREIKALNFLAATGPNIKIHFRNMKECGPDTEDRLKARKFLETFPQEKYPDRTGYYMLTEVGFEAWKAIGQK